MSKRHLSPDSLPPAKRAKAPDGTAKPEHDAHQLLTFDNSIYDELVLCIFSHLSWLDLCAAQATSRNWARLASDNALWKKQYLSVFGRSRLRGSRGFLTRSDRREIKPLPGRAKDEEYRDWKWMFRISSNWKTGRCRSEDVPVPSPPSRNYERPYQTHILLAGPLTIIASSRPASTPQIQVTGLVDEQPFAITCQSTLASESHITAIAMDQSPPSSGRVRFAAFLSTGEFAVYSLDHASPADHACQVQYRPAHQTSRTAPIIRAVYHHPLLVTLSQSFSLSIYDLSNNIVRLTQTLTSFTSFPPTSLVLSTPTNAIYKLVLAYAIPVYPAHWSVGATELIIHASSFEHTQSSATSSLGFSSNTPPTPLHPSMTVQNTRTIRSIDVPQGWIDERKLRAMREQWGRKVSQIADTQTDGKWVVLAPGDQVPYLAGYTPPHGPLSSPSTSSPGGITSSAQPLDNFMKSSPMQSETALQLYRLSLPTPSSSVSASQPKLTFVRTLHGQSGPVSSLALADGRCVSLAHNGSIWVWDLENGTGAEVAAREENARGLRLEPPQGTVVFDERRIISALASNVVVRRFDI